jgi:hypothetical protein
MVRHTATDDRIADEYHERTVDIEADDLFHDRFTGLTVSDDVVDCDHNRKAIEFTYTTRRDTRKTVRAVTPTKSTRDADKVDTDDGVGVYSWYVDGTKYAYTDAGNLYRQGDDYEFRQVADAVDLTCVVMGRRAPVDGAVQDGVDVTVQYRSNRSGNLKTMTLQDVSVEWNGDRIRGYDSRRDRHVEVTAVHERTVETQGRRNQEIGKTARVEFPAGHTFTVTVDGVTDDRVDTVQDRIEAGVERTVDSDFDVTVDHDGRIDD